MVVRVEFQIEIEEYGEELIWRRDSFLFIVHSMKQRLHDDVLPSSVFKLRLHHVHSNVLAKCSFVKKKNKQKQKKERRNKSYSTIMNTKSIPHSTVYLIYFLQSFPRRKMFHVATGGRWVSHIWLIRRRNHWIGITCRGRRNTQYHYTMCLI